MNTHRGFAAATALLVVLGLLIIGGGAYVAFNPQVLQAPSEEVQTEAGDHPEEEQPADAKTSISWKFESAAEVDNIPRTKVLVTVNNKVYDMGTFQGSCAEIGATGGVDGKGLLAGELSAAQCWFAGGGDEIGVFAHEDGGYDIMVGALEESIEGSAGFRGNFEVKIPI